MMRLVLTSVFAVIACSTVSASSPVADETDPPACAPFSAVRDVLDESYGERPSSVATTAGGQMAVVVLTAKDGKTFTILVVGKDGTACVIAAGEHWQAIE